VGNRPRMEARWGLLARRRLGERRRDGWHQDARRMGKPPREVRGVRRERVGVLREASRTGRRRSRGGVGVFEMSVATSAATGVRLIAVDLKAPTTTRDSGVVRISVGDLELCVEVGTDVGYVGALVGALRSRC
jgi:hypothetical protein